MSSLMQLPETREGRAAVLVGADRRFAVAPANRSSSAGGCVLRGHQLVVAAPAGHLDARKRLGARASSGRRARPPDVAVEPRARTAAREASRPWARRTPSVPGATGNRDISHGRTAAGRYRMWATASPVRYLAEVDDRPHVPARRSAARWAACRRRSSAPPARRVGGIESDRGAACGGVSSHRCGRIVAAGRLGSKGAQPVLVVIVLSHNKRERALRCLESVRAAALPPARGDLVDNGSTRRHGRGGRGGISRGPPACGARSNLGAAGGRNLGIRDAGERFAVPVRALSRRRRGRRRAAGRRADRSARGRPRVGHRDAEGVPPRPERGVRVGRRACTSGSDVGPSPTSAPAPRTAASSTGA